MTSIRKSKLVGIAVPLIALIAIAALAIPLLRNHATQVHISEALKAADGAKLVVMEAATTRGGLAHLEAADLAYSGSATNPYVTGVTINSLGHITVTTRNTGAKPDPVLELVPGEAASAQGPAPIVWTCRVVGGDVDAAPEGCHAATVKAPPGANSPAPATSIAH